jgi:glucokinase
MLLVGDIGGTKTDLAIVPLSGSTDPEVEATFRSAEFTHLEDMVSTFLENNGHLSISSAVFGVSGPVVNGQAETTNLPWHKISEQSLENAFGIPKVRLLNDLEAIAHSVPHLGPNELASLNMEQMEAAPGKNKAVVAPGTGLGEAILFAHGSSYEVVASEGGHVSFAPNSLFEIGLLRSLLEKYGHVSYERVCSGGMGIPNIYNYLKDNHYAQEDPAVAQAMATAADRTPIIVQAALNQASELCMETLNVFVSILGAEASNVALKVMALGGIYLGGGIPPRILNKLKDGTFMAAFVKKGRFSDMLSHIPVYVILHRKPALLGSTYFGRSL